MKELINLEPKTPKLYKDGLISGPYPETLYLKKATPTPQELPKYYIFICTKINDQLVKQGYLYFYLDHLKHNSYFIGLSVGEEYRNLNIGSLLISSWIDLCLNNNYNFLGINHKQRKPFLLYLLKTYGFDILDQSLYETRPDIITICRSHDLTDKRKFLLFKSLKHEQVFKGTNIYKTDNYFIVHNTKNLKTLDKIILPLQNAKKDYIDYILLKEEQALNKVNETINKHKR